MPSLPLPFIVALLLLVLVVRLVPTGAAGRGLAGFFAVCAAQAVMIGLRWNYDILLSRALLPVLSAAAGPLAWICLTRAGQGLRRREARHAVPVLLVLGLNIVWWQEVDYAVALCCASYGVALLRRAHAGPDGLTKVEFTDVGLLHRGMLIAGSILLLSTVVEAAVALSFDLGRGARASGIVAAAQMGALLMRALGVAFWRVPAGAVAAPAAPPSPPDVSADAAVVAQIATLMRERHLYRDANLTLDRLAKRAGLPARQISGALNRQLGRNVSQIVNQYRIDDARRRLEESDDAVTAIMLDCGFQTKSNFNREFRRVTGLSPSDYRKTLTAAPPRGTE